jgi:hypothetical protein
MAGVSRRSSTVVRRPGGPDQPGVRLHPPLRRRSRPAATRPPGRTTHRRRGLHVATLRSGKAPRLPPAGIRRGRRPGRAGPHPTGPKNPRRKSPNNRRPRRPDNTPQRHSRPSGSGRIRASKTGRRPGNARILTSNSRNPTPNRNIPGQHHGRPGPPLRPPLLSNATRGIPPGSTTGRPRSTKRTPLRKPGIRSSKNSVANNRTSSKNSISSIPSKMHSGPRASKTGRQSKADNRRVAPRTPQTPRGHPGHLPRVVSGN